MASTFQMASNEVVDLNQICFLPKPTTIDLIGGIYCHICQTTFDTKKEYDSHYAQHITGDQEIVYTCVVCRKQITGYPSFRGHCYLKHVTKDKFKCEYCSKLYSKLSVLKQHVAAMHVFTCTSCNQQFPTKNELQLHQIVHKFKKSKPPYQCNECSQNIDTVDMCELHVEEHSTTEYPCSICEEISPNQPEAMQHLSKHFGEVLIKSEIQEETKPLNEDSSIDVIGGILCCFCNELYKNRIDFDLHFVTEHGDKTLVYTCIICMKQYEKYGQFGNHCYFHISKDRFECDECGKTFPRLSLLVVHTEAFHAGDGAGEGAGAGAGAPQHGAGEAADKPFSCSMCGHAFGSAKRLHAHWRSAHGLERAPCPERGCARSFRSPHALLLHRREHRPPARACRRCGLALAARAAAERHLAVHRVKHYACPVCARAYREKYLALKHIPQHFEVVLHVCNVCGKAYNARARLIEHAKTHSTLRSHTCTYCGKGFIKSYQLEEHLNIHTGRRPYKCTNCPKSFANYANWAKHLQRMHNIDHKLVKKQLASAETKMNVELQQQRPANEERGEIGEVNMEQLVMEGVEAASTPPLAPPHAMDSGTGPARGDSDDSTVDGIDPLMIERELQMFCDNNNAQTCIDDFEFVDMLPTDTITAFITEPAASCEAAVVPLGAGGAAHAGTAGAAVPPEYGPEFVNQGYATAAGAVIDLDDHIMPHIDPLLTIKQDTWEPLYPPVYQPGYQPLYPPACQPLACPALDDLPEASRPLLTDIF